MPLSQEYQSTANTKYLINYHFIWIPKQRKRVLVGKIAKRLRQIFLNQAIEKDWDILALEVARLPYPSIHQCAAN